MSKAILILGLCLFISGCASNTMNDIMSSWENSHIDSAISQWGYPHETREIAGHKLYIWYYNKSYYMPQQSTTTGNVYGNQLNATTYTTGGHQISGSCTRILEVDDAGFIVNWQWKGNNCPLMEVFEYSNWRKKSKTGDELGADYFQH